MLVAIPTSAARPQRRVAYRHRLSIVFIESLMKKSTEYGIGGATFLVAGFSMATSLFLSLVTTHSFNFVFLLIFATLAAGLITLGTEWLWKSQGFYVSEQKSTPLG
jgi:hypothetical protein